MVVLVSGAPGIGWHEIQLPTFDFPGSTFFDNLKEIQEPIAWLDEHSAKYEHRIVVDDERHVHVSLFIEDKDVAMLFKLTFG